MTPTVHDRFDPALEPWRVPPASRPGPGGAREQLRRAVRHAVLAPSGHNTQPWRFRLDDDTVELRADRTRSLPVVDPHDRELVISCGAALETLLVALRHGGLRGAVTLAPDRADPDLLARVGPGPDARPEAEDDALFDAITRRHTHRAAFDPQELPRTLVARLAAEAVRRGAWLHVVSAGERDDVADLVAAADRAQGADRAFRRELSGWVRPNRGAQRDGMRAHAFGVGDAASLLSPLVVRHLDRGATQARADRRLVAAAPLLVVLGTDGDDAPGWLAVGRALARILLRARAHGVQASFLNQPVEVPDLRRGLAAVVGRTDAAPQLLLRLGRGRDAAAQPRRSLADVLDEG